VNGADRGGGAELERLRRAVRFAARMADGINDEDVHGLAYDVLVERTGVDDGADPTDDDYAEAFMQIVDRASDVDQETAGQINAFE
jgi:hypothetical protein